MPMPTQSPLACPQSWLCDDTWWVGIQWLDARRTMRHRRSSVTAHQEDVMGDKGPGSKSKGKKKKAPKKA